MTINDEVTHKAVEEEEKRCKTGERQRKIAIKATEQASC